MTIDPCYIVTSELQNALVDSDLTGFEIGTVDVFLDEQIVMFLDMVSTWPLPKFY